MRLPSKTTTYSESTLARFPVVLDGLKNMPMSPRMLYQVTKLQIPDIAEFIDVLNCLYALRKIEMKGGVLYNAG